MAQQSDALVTIAVGKGLAAKMRKRRKRRWDGLMCNVMQVYNEVSDFCVSCAFSRPKVG